MMKTTLTLATNLHCSPFEVFDQDCDEVILLINFFVEHSREQDGKKKSTGNSGGTKKTGNSQQRIRVNDKTATGSWY